MIDIAQAKIGDKVHHIGFKGTQPENGIIKEIPEGQLTAVRVVYKCAGDWENYMNYTSALTSVSHLYKGWNHDPVEVIDERFLE